jgi:DNA-binding CsgD family transcriptional regulator
MYESVLKLFYGNPEKVDPAQRLREQVQALVPLEHYHYTIKGTADDQPSRLQLNLDKTTLENAKPEISLSQTFDEAVEQDCKNAVGKFYEKFGQEQKFDYYRIVSSDENPGVIVGLFRCTDSSGHSGFSDDEKRLLSQIAPHICLLYRMIFLQLIQQESVYYFGIFSKLASKMIEQHDLSDAEMAIVNDLVFGFTNEEIAERHFISPATVKTHVNHILKKTATKNRVDFISKFFTNPEEVKL